MSQSDPVTQFDTDYNNLINDANDYATLAQEQQDSVTAYTKAYQKLLHTTDPSLLFIQLIYLMSMQGFNELDSNLGQAGGSLQVQGDVTKVDNDLQAITNINSTDSDNVRKEAQDLDKMLDSLSGTSAADKNIQNALGGANGSAVGALYDSDLTMRQYIFLKNDVSPEGHNYNPTQVSPPGATLTYYFDPDDSNYLQSYGEMQADMQQQGNPKGANTAAKGITDQSNMNQQVTSSTNQASTEAITNVKNMISTLQSFTSDMMHAQSDQIKAAIQAPK